MGSRPKISRATACTIGRRVGPPTITTSRGLRTATVTVTRTSTGDPASANYGIYENNGRSLSGDAWDISPATGLGGGVNGKPDIDGFTSGLTFTAGTDIKYSNSVTAPASFAACTYNPVSAYDPLVKFVCLNPKGIMAGSTGTPPSFTLSIQAQVQ